MKRVALAVALLVSLAAPAWAGFDEGWLAYLGGDFETALREWRPLAEQGLAEAQYELGVLYGNGQGVPQDYVEAEKWYSRAAEQGLAVAQYELGLMYYQGQGIPRDYAEGVKWLRLAANQGLAEAQFGLGVAYFGGRGVAQDYVLAYMWIYHSEAGSPPGKQRDAAIMARTLVAESMTPAQIAEAQRLAREWKPKKE